MRQKDGVIEKLRDMVMRRESDVGGEEDAKKLQKLLESKADGGDRQQEDQIIQLAINPDRDF